MVDWVHCNSCCEQPGANRKFVLTNCGHILCEDCKDKGNGNECTVCKKQCLTVPLSSNMKPEVQIYFTDPVELLTRITKPLQELLQVLNFQKDHRQKLTARNREKISILNEVRNEFWKLRKHSKELESENKLLREEVAYLKKMLSRSITPSPNSVTNTPGASHLLFGRLGLNTPNSATGRTPPNSNEFKYRSSQRPSSQENVTIAPGRLSIRTPPISGRMGIIPGQHTPGISAYSSISRRSVTSPADCIQSMISPTYSQPRSSALPSLLRNTNSQRTTPTSLPSLLRQSGSQRISPATGLTQNSSSRHLSSTPISGCSSNHSSASQLYTSHNKR